MNCLNHVRYVCATNSACVKAVEPRIVWIINSLRMRMRICRGVKNLIFLLLNPHDCLSQYYLSEVNNRGFGAALYKRATPPTRGYLNLRRVLGAEPAVAFTIDKNPT